MPDNFFAQFLEKEPAAEKKEDTNFFAQFTDPSFEAPSEEEQEPEGYIADRKREAENAARRAGQVLIGARGGLAGALAGILETGERLSPMMPALPGVAPNPFHLLSRDGREDVREIASDLRQQQEIDNQELQKFRDELENTSGIDKIIGTAIADAAQSSGSSSMSLFGGPFGMVAVNDVYSSTYREAIESGLSPEDAERVAIEQAVPEVIGIIPAGKAGVAILKKLPIIGPKIEALTKKASEGLVRKVMSPAARGGVQVAATIGGEAGEEVVTGTLQDLAMMAEAGRAKSEELRKFAEDRAPSSLEEFLKNRGREAAAAVVMAGPMGVAQSRNVTRDFNRQLDEQSLGTMEAADRGLEEATTRFDNSLNEAIAKEERRIQTEEDFTRIEQEEAQRKADEEEAGFRTMELQNAVSGEGTMAEQLRAAGATTVTPEQVARERQAREQEALKEKQEKEKLSQQLEQRTKDMELEQEIAKRQEKIRKDREKKQKEEQKKAEAKARADRQKVIDEVVEANPDATPDQLRELVNERLSQPQPAGQATPAPAQEEAPVVPQARAEPIEGQVTDDAEIAELTAALESTPVDTANRPTLTQEQSKAKRLKVIDGITRRNTNESASVQNLIRQGKMIVAHNATEVGLPETGAAGVYHKGKMYLFTDNADTNNPVSSVLYTALHEPVHAGQFHYREGRSRLMQELFTPEMDSKVNNTILKAAESGNKIAQLVVKDARKAQQKADDAGVDAGNLTIEGLELAPYLATRVAQARENNTPIGRLGSAVRDMVAAAKNVLREKAGLDIDIDINDLAYVSQKAAEEIVQTHMAEPISGNTPALEMIGGESATGYDAALAGDRVYVGAVDRLPRFEFSDHESSINTDALDNLKRAKQGSTMSLDTLLKHDELYKQYPQLKDYSVIIDRDIDRISDNARGYFSGNGNDTLAISPKVANNTELARSVLLHEIQHAIQEIEGLDPGANPKQFEDPAIKDAYNRERDNYTRMFMKLSLSQDINTLPADVKTSFKNMLSQGTINNTTEVTDLFYSQYASKSNDPAVRRLGEDYKEVKADFDFATAALDADRKKAFEQYLKVYGETEARTTQLRRNMTDDERQLMTPEEDMRYAAGKVPVEKTIPSPNREERVIGEPAASVDNSFMDRLNKRRRDEADRRLIERKDALSTTDAEIDMLLDNSNSIRDFLRQMDQRFDLTVDDYVYLTNLYNGRKFDDKPTVVDIKPKDDFRRDLKEVFDEVAAGTDWARRNDPEFARQAAIEMFEAEVAQNPEAYRDARYKRAVREYYILSSLNDAAFARGDITKEVYDANIQANRDLLLRAEKDKRNRPLTAAPTPFLESSPIEVIKQEQDKATESMLSKWLDKRAKKKEYRAIIEHAQSAPSEVRMLAMRNERLYSSALREQANELGITPDELNDRIQQEIDEAVEKTEGYNESFAAFKAVTDKYGKAGEALLELRNTADELSKAIVKNRLQQGPLSESEKKLYRTIVSNLGRYSHRQYAALISGKENKYSKIVWADYEKVKNAKKKNPTTDISRMGFKETTLANYQRVANAIEFLVNEGVNIPDDAQLAKMDADRVNKLYNHWQPNTPDGVRFNPDLPIDEKRAALAMRREQLTPELLENSAENLSHEILGLGNKGADDSLATYYRGQKLNDSILRQRQQVPLPIRELLGEIKDPGMRMMITAAKQAEFIARNRMLAEIASKPGRDVQPGSAQGTEAVKGMVKVDNSAAWGPLRGYYLSKDLYDSLSDSLISLGQLEDAVALAGVNPSMAAKIASWKAVEVWGKVAGIAKRNTIVFKPANYVFNYVGSYAQLLNNGNVNPKYIVKAHQAAAQIIAHAMNAKNAGPLAVELYKYGVTDSAFIGELKAGQHQELLDLINKMAGKSPSQAMNAWRKFAKGTGEFYAMMDVWSKVANFYQEVDFLTNVYKANGTQKTTEEIKRQAADRVNQTNITYKRSAAFFKATEQMGLTQYANYFYEVYRSQVGNMMLGISDIVQASKETNPKAARLMAQHGAKRIAGQLTVWAGAAALMKAAAKTFSEDDDEDLKYLLPEYIREQDFVPVGRDKDGKLVYWDISRVDPIGPITDLMRAVNQPDVDLNNVLPITGKQLFDLYVAPRVGTKLLKASLGIVDPAKKTSTETLTETFAPDVWDGINAVSPADMRVNKMFVDAAESFLPGWASGFKPTNPVPTTDESVLAGLRLAGTTFYSADPKKAARFAAFDYKDSVSLARRDAKDVLNSSEQGFTQSELASQIGGAIERQRKAFTELSNVVKGMRAAEMSEGEISRTLLDLGLSREQVVHVRRGEFKDMSITPDSLRSAMKREMKNAPAEERAEIKDKWMSIMLLLREDE